MVKVIAGIQLEHGVGSHGAVMIADILCVLPDIYQDRIACLALPIAQGEVYAVRRSFWLVREDIFLPKEPNSLDAAG